MQNENDVLPVKYIEKLDAIPDLTQTDPALGLDEGGMLSCASVAATNNLAWLAENGYERMMLRNEDGSLNFSKTINRLERVMYITTGKGALPPTFVAGIERYLSEQGFKNEDYRLEFQSWLHQDDFEGTTIPNLDAIKKGIIGDGAVWLFVGFYHFDQENDEYQIISHHYLTLVGYGVDEFGNENPHVLIVHDPAPRSGPGTSHDYVHIEEIQHGHIAVDPKSQAALAYPQLPVDAAGYYILGEGLAYNPTADVAILDGVIILEMK
jgi:hypothetical protein